MAIRQRFRDMGPSHHDYARQIRDGARDPQNTRSAPAGQPHSIHCVLDQLRRIRGKNDPVTVDLRVACRPVLPVSITQCQSCTVHTFRDDRRCLTPWRMGKFRCRRGLNFHNEINSVEDGAADTVSVVLAAPRRSAAFTFGIAQITAPARVHRGDELKACRIGDVRGGSGHCRSA
jgi:hypothetical protein